MRALTSLFFALAVLQLVSAEGFGRFGYRPLPDLPGFTLDSEGFTSKTSSAEKFTFGSPARQWKVLTTSEFGQSVQLDAKALGPQKAKYNLSQPGFALYFDKGMRFNLTSIGCPYLTWGEGTVADGVPTPETQWVLVSFRTAQPPILLVAEKGTASFQFKGKAGAWFLTTETPFQGWIRVIQPLGTAEVAANSAASLGKLTKRVFENVSIWTQKAPEFLGMEIKADATSVEAIWKYDRPGAIVPIGAALANVGGYQIKIQTKIRRLSEWNEEGPIAVTEEPTLRIRFPIRRVPLGRSVTMGKRALQPIGTVSPIDIPSVVELGLENLLADRDITTYKAAQETLEAYLGDANYVAEPFTRQQLPFNEAGSGIDLAAAHALLMQATSISNQSTSEANSLLTSIIWREDAYSWTLRLADLNLSRRAAALAVITGFLCPEPERRLQAAILEAGLAAQRGLGILRARKSGQLEPGFTEPLDSLRRYAFFRDIRVADEDPFGRSLQSEVRVFGDSSVVLEKQGEAESIQWTAADTLAHQIVFATAYPIDFDLGNMKKLDVERALGLTQVRYVAVQPGPCTANLRRPDWAKPLPTTASVPKYSEPVK